MQAPLHACFFRAELDAGPSFSVSTAPISIPGDRLLSRPANRAPLGSCDCDDDHRRSQSVSGLLDASRLASSFGHFHALQMERRIYSPRSIMPVFPVLTRIRVLHPCIV